MDIIAKDRMKTASQISYCWITSVNGNKCTVLYNNELYTIPYYGGIVKVNKTYPITIPQNNMNKAFIVGETIELSSGSGYCKLPDGTLICYGRVQFPSTEAESNSTQSVTFSPAFTTRPAVTVSPVREAAQTPYLFPVSVYTVSASEVTFAFSNRYDVTVSNMYADWIAIGRWK